MSLSAKKTNWRSAMTLPRTLSLSTIKGDYVLQSQPVAQFVKQLSTDFSIEKIKLNKGVDKAFAYSNINQSEIDENRLQGENVAKIDFKYI